MRNLIRPLALLLTLAAPGASSLAAPSDPADPCAVPKSLTRLRPALDGPPIQVRVGVRLVDIVDVDELKESFTVDFLLSLSWRDPRLAAEARGGAMDDCVLDLSDVWDPDVHPVNQRGMARESARDVDIAPDGTVRYGERILAELSTPLDLEEFPFDRQALKIQLISFEYGPEDVVFEIDEADTGRLESAFLGGWDIVENSSLLDVPAFTINDRQYTRLEHSIVLERRSGYFIWKFVVPLTFIVLMAWSVFWIDPQAAAPQIGVATASVFSLIAFLIGLRGVLPRVEYLTRIDKLVLSATVLVFLALGEAIVTTRLVARDRYETALRIDQTSRWVYLGLFAVVFVVQLFV